MRTLLFLPLLLAGPAFAQDQTAEIVVTGTGLPVARGDAAYDIVTIDRDRLTGSASGRMEDILRDVAGFQQFRRADSRSAHPTSQGATLRGLGGNASSRALILLDGVPQIDPFGGWVSWSAYEPMRLGAARVTRGGGSGVYGPGALAGTIELMSATAMDLSPIWGGVSYGSRNSVDADLGLSGNLGGGFASISAGYARGDGFIPIVREARGPVDEAAPYEQASVAARAVIPIGDETELQVSGLGMIDRRTRGVPFTPNRNLGADASARLVGKGRWGWEAVAYLQLREFSSGFASVNAARTIATPSLDQYRVPATGIGGRVELRPPLGERIELRIGADARVTQGRTQERYQFSGGSFANNRIAGGTTRTAGAFAELAIDALDGVTLTGGGRIDRWWIVDGYKRQTAIGTGALLPGSADFSDRAGTRPTGRAGVAWQATGAITLRAASYLGWRLPTLNELYRPFRVGVQQTLANELLKPERLRGVDGGVDYRPLPGVRLGATIFWNRLADAIGNVTTAPNTSTRENIDAIRSRGLELDGAITLAPWSLSASYAYVDARVRSTGAAIALDGLRPAQTPRHQASATLGWSKPDGPHAAVTLRYVAQQFEDDLNSRTLADAVTVDALVALPVAAGFTIEARAENLANARVETGVTGVNLVERASPRTLWLGVRYGR